MQRLYSKAGYLILLAVLAGLFNPVAAAPQSTESSPVPKIPAAATVNIVEISLNKRFESPQPAKSVIDTALSPKPPGGAVIGSHTDLMAQAGIAASDFSYTEYIIEHESGWDVYNLGPMTSMGQACHLEQTLPCGKDGCSVTDAVCQLRWFKGYCINRYGSIAGAYSYWLVHHNY